MGYQPGMPGGASSIQYLLKPRANGSSDSNGPFVQQAPRYPRPLAATVLAFEQS